MVMHPIKPEMNGNDLSAYKDPNGKLLFVDFVDTVRKSGAGFVPYEWPKPGFEKPQPKLSYVVGFAPWNWVIGTGVYIDDVNAQTWASTRRSLIAAGLILLFALAVSILVARSITGPLRHMTVAMNDLASGNLAVGCPVSDAATRSARWPRPSKYSRAMPSRGRRSRPSSARRRPARLRAARRT
jgi:methyl-accepting chemotaxis protein